MANCKEDDKNTKGHVSTTAEEAQAIDADGGNDLESDQLVAKQRKAEAKTEDTPHNRLFSMQNFLYNPC